MSDDGDWDDTRVIPRIDVDPTPTTTIQLPQEDDVTLDSRRAETLVSPPVEQQDRAAAIRSAMEVLRDSPLEPVALSDVIRLATWLLYGVDSMDLRSPNA